MKMKPPSFIAFASVGIAISIILLGVDLSLSATSVYGPEKFVRAKGKAVAVTKDFTAPSATAHYKLTVLNGEKGENRISNAIVKINGKEVLGGRDFRKKADSIERYITLRTSNSLSINRDLYNLSINLISPVGGFITVAIECLDCLDISILSPSMGDMLNALSVLVKGTMTTVYGDVGVSVNGFPAAVSGNNWAARIPLTEGLNTVTAKIMNFSGNNAQKTINVNVVPLPETIDLSVRPESGLAPLQVELSLTTDLDQPPSLYQLDFEGNGIIDYTINTFENITHTYNEEGIYFPTVTVTDSGGKKYTATTYIEVMDKDKINAHLRSRWSGMKESLVRKDIPKGLNSFVESSKEAYQQMFNVLSDELPQIFREMQDMEMVFLRDNVAKFRINRVHDIDGTPQTITYYIYFVKDSDGVWRIDRF